MSAKEKNISTTMNITYNLEPNLSAAEFRDLLSASGLAPRRPADDVGRLDKMLRGAQLIVTARADGQLCGIARSITDWAYCLYCSDLCVARAWQGKGIGKGLLSFTADAAPAVKACILLSAPDASNFYEAAGYDHHNGAYLFAKRG